jgi:hypothetical protein
MKKLVLCLALSSTMFASAIGPNCHALGNSAYEATINSGTTENQAAAIANAVIDACEAGLVTSQKVR